MEHEEEVSFKDLVSESDSESEFQIKEASKLIDFVFKGLNEILCEICTSLKWNKPTKIQKETLPYALEGKDIIGLAETGSYSQMKKLIRPLKAVH